jgi:hypothetical protein
MRNLKLITLAAVAMACAGPAWAISFTASDAFGRAASVDFTISGTSLVVTLTNTSTADVLVPIDVLTGVFFDVAGNPALSSGSALLGSGSSVFYDPDGQPADGNVGGEWGFAINLSGAPGGAKMGISSSGLGLFGGATFPGEDLASPAALNGLQYGILSAGDDAATGNGGIAGTGGLIKNSVVFTLGDWDPTLNSVSVSNVSFQYGTALTEPNIRVPDGSSTVGLLGLAFCGLAVAGRLSRRR